MHRNLDQSVTSRLETSRYRDFSQFFESIGLGLENFGLEKKSRYWSRKYLVSIKVSVSVSKTLVSKKSLGIETFLNFLRVSVSVSKIFSLEKKSRYRSRKYLVSKKSLGIGLENFGLKKSLGFGLKNFGLKKSLSNDLKKFVLKNFVHGNVFIEFGLPTSPNMPNMPNNEQHV